MAYQQKEGQGSLFRNDKQNERQPDFKGTIMIKGVTYNVSAWNRTSQNGREYISLQAEEKPADGQQPSYQRRPGGYQAPQAPQGGYQAPRPAYQQPSYQQQYQPQDVPPPGLDDMPAFDDAGDLPF